MAAEFSDVTPGSPGYGAVNFYANNPMPDQLMRLLAQARSGQDVTSGLTPQARAAFQALQLRSLPNPTAFDSAQKAYADLAYSK